MDQPLHIAVFVDQHPDTLGGMQTSVRLQRKFLEAAGHRVTIVSPAGRGRAHRPDPGLVELPSVPLGPGEYSCCLPGRNTDRALDSAMRGRPPVDVVHVQADFWQAMIGYRFAERAGAPVVHTMHNQLEAGMRATVPFPGAVQRAFGLWQKRALGGARPAPSDAWAYLRRFTDRARLVTAPSTHFARFLEEREVFEAVDVVSNGLDDDVAAELLASPKPPRGDRPRLVWIGRFSAEKRLLPFLEAVDASGIDAEVHVFGDGALRAKARRRAASIARAGVVFRGTVPYRSMLAELRAADALVQTSQGFETQGMTVFEAAALGTPTVLSDRRIAADLPDGGYWPTPDDTVGGLARALSAALADLSAAGARPESSFDTASFLQSRQTAAMVDVYRRAVAGAPVRRGLG